MTYMTSTPIPEPSILMTLETTEDMFPDGSEMEDAETPSFVSFADLLHMSGKIAVAHDFYDLLSLPIDQVVEISAEKGIVLDVMKDSFRDQSVVYNDCFDLFNSQFVPDVCNGGDLN